MALPLPKCDRTRRHSHSAMEKEMSTSPAKATRINLFSFTTPQMRAFHMAWLAFFVCFFAWFAIAPMMGTVRAEMKLTKDQIANIGIASVAGTIFARLLLGWLCEKIG